MSLDLLSIDSTLKQTSVFLPNNNTIVVDLGLICLLHW